MSNSDKIQEGFQRIYFFLSDKDWETEADYNKNNIIDNSEFKQYLSDGDIDWNGLESNKNDIINRFWQTIDTNRSGKIKGTKSTNAYNLDQNEIDALNAQLQTIGYVKTFLDKKASSLVTGNQADEFQKDFKQKMSGRMMPDLAGKTLTGENDAQISESYNKFVKEVFVTCYVGFITEKQDGEIKTCLNELGSYYDIDQDKTLQGIIQKYIQNLGSGELNFESIKSQITAIIQDYIETAELKDFAAITDANAVLRPYGYEQPANGTNEIQKAALQKGYEKAIKDALKDDDYYKNNQADFDPEIVKYVADLIKTGSYATLKAGISNAGATFKTSKAYTDIKTKIDQEKAADFTAKKTELVNDILSWLGEHTAYASDCEAALKTAFGVSSLEEITGENGLIKKAADQTALDGYTNKFNSAKDAAQAVIDRKTNYTDQYACEDLAEALDGMTYTNLTCAVYDTIHTEFGMDADGNIVFEQEKTTEQYDRFVKKLLQKLKEKDLTAYEKLGEGNIKKLIQAAWIMSYNSFDSSKSNNTEKFINVTLANLTSILDAISKNPEYLKIFTGHTAYANSAITDGVDLYSAGGYGGDGKINFGGCKIEDGVITLKNPNDDAEYKEAMDEILKNLKSTYTSLGLDEATIEKLFNQAKLDVIDSIRNRATDCPYGTAYGSRVVMDESIIATGGQDWKGAATSDKHGMPMKALIELTLYKFDKLLYAELTKSTDDDDKLTADTSTMSVLSSISDDKNKMTGAVITANGKYELDIKSDLMNLYANNSNIVLGANNWGKAETELDKRIDQIVEALKSTGMFDESVLTDAANKVKSDYKNTNGNYGDVQHKINATKMLVTGNATIYSVNLRDLIDDIIAKYKELKGLS